MDEEAYDDFEFTLEYMTNLDMQRVFAEQEEEPLESYSDTLWDKDETSYPDTSQDLKDQIKMATMECSKGIIPNQLAMLGSSTPE